ncbi:hypothetical protein OTSGILL_2084 [Orientia tsutsugamushi str. Gilliam]|uniref:Uncharacterized protein n=1 Tax=Orientia tsutsugamushi str. Gilliam TaxID=1359184 RepID=A0A0F3MAR0_ORITS|nr:hypothetical protein OTSGILL_2084 [Orientia tsutsugamushi str. Gilliam]
MRISDTSDSIQILPNSNSLAELTNLVYSYIYLTMNGIIIYYCLDGITVHIGTFMMKLFSFALLI